MWLLPPLLWRGRAWQGRVGLEQGRRSSLDGNPRGPRRSSPLQGLPDGDGLLEQNLLSVPGDPWEQRKGCVCFGFYWLALDSSRVDGGRSLSITEMDTAQWQVLATVWFWGLDSTAGARARHLVSWVLFFSAEEEEDAGLHGATCLVWVSALPFLL